MSLAISLNPFLNLRLPGPGIKGTTPQPLIATHPSTLLPGNSADTDSASPQDNPSPLAPVLTDLDPSLNDEKLYSSAEIEWLWDRILQTNLTEDNSGLHASDYHVVQAVNLFYIKFPTRPCAWFIIDPGYFGRAYSSDKTKPKSGAVLHLEDRTISTNMLTEEYSTHYIHLTKPTCCDSHLPTLSPSQNSMPVTKHQRVLKEDYTITPLRTWDRDPFYMMPLKNMTWYDEKETEPEVRVDWFTSSEDDIREEVVRILKAKESGSG
ncbi:hypothetical protein PILCRDRAFT_10511 [Piloderma croceum F 1598]|uniref:Uncharacterized protein n=1 Tax=Piloderma croceum (strain F 1598) TaxID=765440 RepID=A0A0C3FHY5_PILCF|nr:hypothetical protein PILCRDRAFT_10511 [Piloderma croceum F 1598]